MKTWKLLSLVLMTVLFAGCNDDDDNGTAELSGAWKLTRIQGGFAGVDETFAPGVITWNFNDNQTVTIVNNNTDDAAEDLFESGTYDYAANTTGESGECGTQLSIDGTGLGCMTLGTVTLKLSQQSTDGFDVTLKR